MREKLINERNNRGLTRREVAEALDVAEVTVRKLEEGGRNPSPQMAKKFAMFYQKDIDFLFPDVFLVNFDTKTINY